MKYFVSLLLTTLFTLSLEASYLRTINIASFTTEHDAKIYAYKLKIKYRKDKIFSDLQYEWDFKFKVLESGKYYVVKLEPFTQPDVLQEILDILRVENKSVIVKKLVATKLEKRKEPKSIELQKNSPTIEKETVTKQKHGIELNDFIWQILFGISFLSFLIALRVIVVYKREMNFNKKIALSAILPENKESLDFFTEENLAFEDEEFTSEEFDEYDESNEGFENEIEYSKESIAKILGLDRVIFDELYKEYCREARNSLYLITEAINVQDYKTSKKEAIKLKGMCDNMRIPSVTCELNSIINSKNRYEINVEVSKIELVLGELSGI